MLKLGVAKWAGLEIVDSLPPELKFIKLLSLGIGWAMLDKSSSMQTQWLTVIYTLVTQLIVIFQQFITTILIST